jgi:hypothetical protein
MNEILYRKVNLVNFDENSLNKSAMFTPHII